MSDFIDDFHKAVIDWADHVELEGDERENFIEFMMEKKGYKRATTWNTPDPDPNEQGGGGMFSKKKTAPSKPQPRQQQGGPAGPYFRK